MEFGYYLMIKEAVGLNIKYLCKCADYKDPLKYKGSGIYWRRILKKHNPVIVTTILGHYGTNYELRQAGIYYSQKYNIVEDVSWANLIEEIGDGGSTTKNTVRAYNVLNPKEIKNFKTINEIPVGWKRGMPKYTKDRSSIERTAEFHRGRKRSDLTKMKMRTAIRKERMKVICKNCNKLITTQNLKRHQMSEKCN